MTFKQISMRACTHAVSIHTYLSPADTQSSISALLAMSTLGHAKRILFPCVIPTDINGNLIDTHMSPTLCISPLWIGTMCAFVVTWFSEKKNTLPYLVPKQESVVVCTSDTQRDINRILIDTQMLPSMYILSQCIERMCAYAVTWFSKKKYYTLPSSQWSCVLLLWIKVVQTNVNKDLIDTDWIERLCANAVTWFMPPKVGKCLLRLWIKVATCMCHDCWHCE